MPESWGASATVYRHLLAGNKVSSGVSAGVVLLSRCSVFRQQSVKMSRLLAVDPLLWYFLGVISIWACRICLLGSYCCQDVPSFGNSLSRCLVFRQLIPFCGIFWVFLAFELVRFVCWGHTVVKMFRLRQQSVKMSRLSSVDPLLWYFLGVISIWPCKICLLGSYCCQDVPSFGNSLSRCLIFRQFIPFCGIFWVFLAFELVGFVCWGRTVVKMFRLSAIVCQDVGSWSPSVVFSGCF